MRKIEKSDHLIRSTQSHPVSYTHSNLQYFDNIFTIFQVLISRSIHYYGTFSDFCKKKFVINWWFHQSFIDMANFQYKESLVDLIFQYWHSNYSLVCIQIQLPKTKVQNETLVKPPIYYKSPFTEC